MQAISKSDLEAVVRRINTITKQPLETYELQLATDTEPSRYVAQIGNYHLSGAYGGYALHQICNEAGGIRDLFGGHMPKRELYERMQAYIRGLNDAAQVQA